MKKKERVVPGVGENKKVDKRGRQAKFSFAETRGLNASRLTDKKIPEVVG